jgi:hypothetical protein
MTASVHFAIPVKTKNAMNANFGNSRTAAIAQARADAAIRDKARALTDAAIVRAGVHRAELVPAKVTLTRISSGRLDEHDGLPPALKRVVDGIALALGVDDGGPFVRWVYEQREAGRRGLFGVVVLIERQKETRS